ncbi:MAG: hypothetical protein M3071_01635 [Actinomycetota bacterium]|nr:hypothetical protein [Actinomycetota bacterium]
MTSGAVILPAWIEGPDGLLLRQWTASDAEALGQAVAASGDHPRPWMPWMVGEPQTVERRRTLLTGWERDWSTGGDVLPRRTRRSC